MTGSGDDLVMYAKQLANGDLAIGLFNLGDKETAARINLDVLGLPASTGKTLRLHEVWTKEEEAVRNQTLIKRLDAYDCAVYRAKVVDF